MRRFVLRALLIGTAWLAATPANAGGYVVGTIGERSLDDDFWGEVDSQTMVGALASFSVGEPFYIAVGVQGSSKDDDSSGNKVTGTVVDATVGLQVMLLPPGPFRTYLAGGLASVSAEGKVDGAGVHDDFDDQSVGYWAGGGVLFHVNRNLVLGGDVRWIGGTEIDFGGDEGDADSLAASFVIGYAWE
jgi:opacity protein-like surface antigen